jgi:hypothetical protein
MDILTDIPNESSSAIPPLPREIIDMISDFLFDDKIALANMSLVCRALLPSARDHLFRTLTLSANKLWEDGRRAPSQVSEIVDVLTTLAPLVRALKFRFQKPLVLDSEKWARVFLPCLSVFKGVVSLSLKDFPLAETASEIRSELFTCFSDLLELFIVNGYFGTVNIVLLSLLPRLQGLYLYGTIWWQGCPE